jgi:hypothetical protein
MTSCPSMRLSTRHQCVGTHCGWPAVWKPNSVPSPSFPWLAVQLGVPAYQHRHSRSPSALMAATCGTGTHFVAIVGEAAPAGGPAKRFGFVQSHDPKPRRHLAAVLTRQGLQHNQELVFPSDGE